MAKLQFEKKCGHHSAALCIYLAKLAAQLLHTTIIVELFLQLHFMMHHHLGAKASLTSEWDITFSVEK